MDLKEKALVAYGTSRTKGDFASSPSLRWVNLLSSESNGTFINFGVNGAKLVGDFIKENVIEYNPDLHGYMIFEFGTNDIRSGVYADAFGSKLMDDIGFIINQRGWPAKNIIIQNAYWAISGDFYPNEYNPYYLAVVNEYGVNFADYFSYFKSLPDISSYFVSDGIHENDFGNRTIANFYKGLSLPALGGGTVTPTLKVFRGKRSILNYIPPVIPPSGERITGRIPVQEPLWFTSLTTPPIPTISEIFRDNDFPPNDFYGNMSPYPGEDVVLQDFPIGQEPIIETIEYGSHNGNHTDSELRIYGIKSDNTEELMFTVANNAPGTYPIANPKLYKRLRYSVRGNARPNYIKFYGSYVDIAQNPVVYTKYPLGNHMGVNGHNYSLMENINNINERSNIYAPALQILKRLGRFRCYVNNQSIFPTSIDEGYFDKDVQGYYTDNMLKQLYEDDIHFVYVAQGSTPFINITYPDQNNNERLPITYTADRFSAAAWAPYAEMMFQIALRYGTNPNNLPLSRSNSKEGYFFNSAPEIGSWTKKVGLGWVSEIEPYNEIDKWWKGMDSYAQGEVMAIAMNEIYTRIKEADPNIQVTYPGLATYLPDILQDFVNHSMDKFGYIPVDNYAFHFYSNSAGQQHVSGAVGTAIELGAAKKHTPNFRESNFRRLGNKPVDCGEQGWDCSMYSPIRVIVPTGSNYTQREWSGVLYLRASLWNAKNGIRATYFYEWSDLNANDDYTQFAKMGFTYTTGASNNQVYQTYPNYNALVQLRTEFKDYVHSVQISDTPLVDRWNFGSNTMYSLYHPTESNISSVYSLILNGVTSVTKYTLNLNSLSFTSEIITVTGGSLDLQISETPTFIKVN